MVLHEVRHRFSTHDAFVPAELALTLWFALLCAVDIWSPTRVTWLVGVGNVGLGLFFAGRSLERGRKCREIASQRRHPAPAAAFECYGAAEELNLLRPTVGAAVFEPAIYVVGPGINAAFVLFLLWGLGILSLGPPGLRVGAGAGVIVVLASRLWGSYVRVSPGYVEVLSSPPWTSKCRIRTSIRLGDAQVLCRFDQMLLVVGHRNEPPFALDLLRVPRRHRLVADLCRAFHSAPCAVAPAHDALLG
jgi:hypothetical protein